MIGTTISNRYRVDALVGTGGMANVYRAFDVKKQRIVALKLLKREFIDNNEFLRRFEQEANAVKSLHHDNIVKAYGVGEVDGLPYIVLEYVEGPTLKEYLNEHGQLEQVDAIKLVLQLLKALSAAHKEGFIHRDVKPQNVILANGNAVKLTDFGIARDVTAGTVTYDNATVLGSIHYLSPEQATGKLITAKSDIYSVGVLLYELLCGTVPFSGDTPIAVAYKHVNEMPVPPIEKNPTISPALNDVILRALSKEPSERYPSARAMAQALLKAYNQPEEYLRDLRKHEKKPPRRRFQWIYAIGAMVFLMLAGIAFLFFQAVDRFQKEGDRLTLVPTLTGCTLEEAVQKAQNYGFIFEAQSYEESEEVASGRIITQAPDPGTPATPGTTVYGVVSLGADMLTMPPLIGKTLDEAQSIIHEEGLVLRSISYRVSDVAIGYICLQTPVAGAEIQPGAAVELVISSASPQSFAMESLVGLPFADALKYLAESGFTSVLVKEVALEGEPSDAIVEQSPAEGESVVSETPILLTLNRMEPGGYSADVAFNVDVPENDATVLVTLAEADGGVAYERVLYEAVLQKGEKVPVSFTAHADVGGLMELRLYVNGSFVRSGEITFLERST